MQTVEKNTPESSENIDLLLLVERTILFFKRYKWTFIICAMLGIGLGVFGYIKIPNTYKSRLILHSFFLSNQEHIGVIDNWNALIKRKEYDDLAAALGCDKKILVKLKKIQGSEIQKVFTPNNPNGFFVDVEVTDNAILDELQKCIANGLENNEYIKERLEQRRSDLKELIGEVENEIQKLDSTKIQVEKIIEGKQKSSSSVIIDVSSINRQLIDMNEKLLGYKQDLRFTNAVQIIQGFSKFNKPSDPKLIPLIALGLILFLGIAYIIALISSINESLKRKTKQDR
jgi:hypothetical protein